MIAPLDKGNRGLSVRLPQVVKRIFASDGILVKELGMEYRPEQESLAVGIAESMVEGKPLLCEAGTGVGKSLAYLIPGLIFSVDTERPMIISSHTIALQEQLVKTDLGICRQLFSKIPQLEAYSHFKMALLVGKGNYVCNNRLRRAASGQQELSFSAEGRELHRLMKWAEKSKKGLRQELNPMPPYEVWEKVNADSSTCNKKNCSPDTCCFRKAKAEAANANILVLNHSLLFSLLNAGAGVSDAPGILVPDDFLVLDEGHTVPNIATSHFGMAISSYGMELCLKLIYNPGKSRRRDQGDEELAYKVSEAMDSVKVFFSFLREEVLGNHEAVRIQRPGFCDTAVVQSIIRLIEFIAEKMQDIKDENKKAEMADHRRRLESYSREIIQFIELKNKDHVHWIEGSGKAKQNVTLRSAPIDIRDYLKRYLFLRNTSVTVTSATLSTGDDLKAFKAKSGSETAREIIEKSPFDYEKNVQIYLAVDGPMVSARRQESELEYLSEMCNACIKKVAGGTLLLFTSYSDLRRVSDRLRVLVKDREIYAQGEGIPRMEMLKLFKKQGNAILLGTDSFWTGVDVPGSALSQVVITRLPFESPSHPIQEAKHEFLRANGRNPFLEHSLPEALIKFRQGVGRLIRKQGDKGIITVLDSRILKKEYGQQFINALPKKNYVRLSRENHSTVFQGI